MSLNPDSSLVLPASVISPADLARLVNDVEQLDADLTTTTIQRKSGLAAEPDSMTDQARSLFDQNSLNPQDAGTRQELIKILRQLKAKAPVFYLRFAAEVGNDEQQQLANWFRQSVNRHSLLDVRVQPAIIGGVYIRSKNRVFDLSWRQRFVNSRRVIGQKVRELAV